MLLRNHSALSPLPSARNCPVLNYALYERFPSLSCLLRVSYIPELRVSPSVRCVLRVAILYACRIRELLLSTLSAVIHPDRLLLHGSKGSSSYFVYLPGLSSLVDESGNTNENTLIFSASYSACYRACVSLGIGICPTGHIRLARTHSGRHLLAIEVDKIESASVAGECLRHKSNKSIFHYI